MNMSTAIRLGAMLRPQAFGVVFDGVGTCGIGAAMDACGRLDGSLHGLAYEMAWPMEQISNAACPACGRERDHLRSEGTIPHLNDCHKWTREQIADWVETIETVQADALSGDREATALDAACVAVE